MARAGHLPLPSVAARGSGFGAAVFVAAAAALAYVIAAHIGFRLAFVAEQVTTVWAPSGIAIATLLLWGPRLWPAIWIGAFAANAVTTAPLWTAVFIATGNTLEAVAAASILGRVPGFSPTLRRVADVLAFLIAAVVLCPAISASIGVATLASAGVQPWTRFTPLWWNWWFGDALGAVIFAPAILMTMRRDWPRGDLLRAAAFAAAAIAITGLVFGSASFNTHPIEYIVFPLAIAAAVSGGPAITSLVVLCASSIAIWYTSRGAGPFSGQTVHDSLVLLQVFMGVLAATALLLAAAIAERRASEDREHEAAEVLRHREEMLRLAQRAGGVATFEWDFTRQTAICSAEFFRIFGLPAVEGVMIASDWANYVHPDDREPMATHLSRALAGLEPAAADYRIVTARGQTRWLSYAGQIEKTQDGERLLGTVVDITHRKDLETELRQANAVKDEFLATLSHELRTPLTRCSAGRTCCGRTPSSRRCGTRRSNRSSATHGRRRSSSRTSSTSHGSDRASCPSEATRWIWRTSSGTPSRPSRPAWRPRG